MIWKIANFIKLSKYSHTLDFNKSPFKPYRAPIHNKDNRNNEAFKFKSFDIYTQ